MGYIIFFIACAFIGTAIGENKGRGITGLILGLLLGPLGCIIIYFIPGNRVNCPHCKSLVSPKATTCPGCSKDIIPDYGDKDYNISNPDFFSFEEWRNIFLTKEKSNKDFDDKTLKTIFQKEREYFNKKNKHYHYVTKANNSSQTNNALKRLNDLSSLKDKGLITDSEYNEKREEILKSL